MASLCCPTCGNRFDPEQTPARPFCSHRCREIDLGRWLSEKHAVPNLREEPQEEDGGQLPPESAGPPDSEEET